MKERFNETNYQVINAHQSKGFNIKEWFNEHLHIPEIYKNNIFNIVIHNLDISV